MSSLSDVDERTVLVNTMTAQGGLPERLDPEGVLAKFGVPPMQIIEVGLPIQL